MSVEFPLEQKLFVAVEFSLECGRDCGELKGTSLEVMSVQTQGPCGLIARGYQNSLLIYPSIMKVERRCELLHINTAEM